MAVQLSLQHPTTALPSGHPLLAFTSLCSSPACMPHWTGLSSSELDPGTQPPGSTVSLGPRPCTSSESSYKLGLGTDWGPVRSGPAWPPTVTPGPQDISSRTFSTPSLDTSPPSRPVPMEVPWRAGTARPPLSRLGRTPGLSLAPPAHG